MAGFCSSTGGNQTDQGYIYKNPLGPSASQGGTGAAELQNNIFNGLQEVLPQTQNAGSNYASALTSAASNPGWGAVTTNATNNAAGNYLSGSPQLNSEMAWNTAQTAGNTANQDARIKSNAALNGMGFSTTNQQALEANNAASGAASAANNANVYGQNYQAERANQNAAGSQLAQAQQNPLAYLGAVPGAYTAPLQNAAQITSGLGSGGQWLNNRTQSSTVDNPSLGSDIMSGVGAL